MLASGPNQGQALKILLTSPSLKTAVEAIAEALAAGNALASDPAKTSSEFLPALFF